jgi:hypothetical protein
MFAPSKFTTQILLMKFIVLILLLSSTLLAQTGKISGSVNDASEHTLDGAVVSLFNAKDSTLEKLLLSEANGLFEFENLKQTNYFLVISNVDFQNYKSEILSINEQNQFISLPKIT